jgi:hypothetical protein
MAKKPDVAADLSAKLTQALEAQRDQGATAYPTTLGRLCELTDPSAPSDLVFKATGKRPFSEGAVVARKKSLDAPAALREDLEQLAGSRQILHFVLNLTCTETSPTATLAALKKKLDKTLQVPFEQAVRRQIAENALPSDMEWLPKEKALHPRRLKLLEQALAERLVQALEAQRLLGSESYPVWLSRLVELAGISGSSKLIPKAQKLEPFATRVLPLIIKGKKDTFLGLADDLEQAVASPVLLRIVLESIRNDTAQAFSVSELKAKLVKPARAAFADALKRQIEEGSLPPGVGWIGRKKERLLFRLEDVRGASTAPSPPKPAPEVTAAPAGFEAAFDEAFAQLDRQSGSYNFVSLVDLRRAMTWDRTAFDAQLRRLREAGRYTLSAAEGRHGITEEQRAAGITEDGSLLLFASRR